MFPHCDVYTNDTTFKNIDKKMCKQLKMLRLSSRKVQKRILKHGEKSEGQRAMRGYFNPNHSILFQTFAMDLI